MTRHPSALSRLATRASSALSALSLAALCALCSLVGAACSTRTDVVACTSTSGCAAGSVCVAGACTPLDSGVLPDQAPLDQGSLDSGPRPDQGDQGDQGVLGFCAGSGPLVVPVAGTDSCTGAIAENSFRFAVCSCGEFVVSNTFTTDSFDSRDGAYDAMSPGSAGGFGTNGAIDLRAAANVGGSAWASGGGVQANAAGALTVAGNLRTAGAIDSAANVQVDQDADINGDITADDLSVGGALTQPGGAMLTVNSSSIQAQASGVVSVEQPCPCGSDAVVDPAALVAEFSTSNDNMAAEFDPSVLAGHGPDTVVDLPCGRLYVPSISGTGNLTLRVSGRTALFVGGDLNPSGEFRVEVVGEGELDLFVAGNLVSAQRLSLGTAATPSRVRLYLGGSQPVALSGGGVFAGFVYAPFARFTMSTAIEIYGALFAFGIVASDTLTVHYDESIQEAASECDPPPPGCTECGDCLGQACNGGTCGSCSSDDDCCAPFTCVSGVCGFEFG